jgi:hypothetical protein
MTLSELSTNLFKRQVALPQDHGAWVFLFSPLLIGLFAGGRWSASVPALVTAALAAFMLRQPASMLVKSLSGRRTRRELPAAIFWIVIYSLVGLAAVVILIQQGFAYLLWLGLAGVPVFAWHLILISRRAERRQLGVELVGSGVLALAAPAGLWVGLGRPDPLGWWLWGLAWLQSAASIVYAYLRLAQRELPDAPPLAVRWKMGSRAVLYTTFNLLAAAGLGFAGITPRLVFIPYALQWLETLWGALRPAVGVRPTRIGLRQLAVSSLFTVLFILAWGYR